MQVAIGDIVVGDRVRKDLGDLSSLMNSLAEHGQLSPIVITRQNELVAGHRRLTSARRLGWYTIDAVIVDRVSEIQKLEMELEENVLRKDFSPEELLAGYGRLERLRRPTVARRVGSFFAGIWRRLFRRQRPAAALRRPTPEEAAAGMGSPEDVA
jgi:ParB family chromosome partitioning protein